jgi:hypothetical protein
MKSILVLVVLLAACGTQGHGERCNPMRATSDCDPGFSCVFPTKPHGSPCGVSFCCTVDANGNITDSNPNCQPDPESAAACGLDLGMSIPEDMADAD